MSTEVSVVPDVIQGSELLLRAWRPSDVDALAAAVARNIEHLRPWMAWVTEEPLPRERRLALIDGWAASRGQGGDVVFGVFEEDEVVGGTGLHRRQGPHCLEIGYWVDAGSTGRGIATEVARLLTGTALSQQGITCVEIHHDKANVASGRVPAKLGYTLVGEAPRAIEAPGQVGIDCTWRVQAEGWRGRHEPRP